MTPTEVSQEFFSNSAKMEKYREAIANLREAGFESVLRRLGEPEDSPIEADQLAAQSAFESFERKGWYRALSYVFDFQKHMEEFQSATTEMDFGASDDLEMRGYDVNK